MSDAAALVKHTGCFYDRYSEMHKVNSFGEGENSRIIPGSVLGNDRGGFCQNCGAAGTVNTPGSSSNPRPSAKAAFLRGYQPSLGGSSPNFASGRNGDADVGVGLAGSSSFAPTATGTTSAGSQPWGGEGECSGNFLGRTVEHGVAVTAAAAAAEKDGCAALRELDRQCYSLLESNAQLCLKLQGLGLEYAGLTRVLLAAGGEVRHGPIQPFLVCGGNSGLFGGRLEREHTKRECDMNDRSCVAYLSFSLARAHSLDNGSGCSGASVSLLFGVVAWPVVTIPAELCRRFCIRGARSVPAALQSSMNFQL